MNDPGAPARVLIVAGEASGDLYGGLLMRAMSTPSGPAEGLVGLGGAGIEFTGAGGPAMREAGLRPLADASALGVTGVFEVLGRFMTIWKAYRRSRAVLEAAHRPDLAILIDYPDFNLRLAARAKRAGVPVLYFISPQVWAWRRGRVRRMAGVVDRLLVILPFEEAIYRQAGVPVEFIGHPLLDLVRAQRTRRQERSVLGLDPDRPVIALLPGSRRNEMTAHLGPMLEAATRLKDEFRDLQCLLVVAPTFDRREVAERVAAASPSSGARPVLVSEDRYDAVASADAAMVASGTATLETALLGVPMVVVYRMNPVTFALARRLMLLQDIGMPNLIAGRRVVPELVQDDCTGQAIALQVRRLLTDRAAAEQMRRDLAEVRERLGRSGAIPRAARSAWSMIHAARRARVA